MGFAQHVDAASQRILVRQGFQLLRHNLRMVIELDGRPPEPIVPAGITLRTIVPGQEEYPAFIASREAFQRPLWSRGAPTGGRIPGRSHRVLNSWTWPSCGSWHCMASRSLAYRCASRPRTTIRAFGWCGLVERAPPLAQAGLGLALSAVDRRIPPPR